MPTTDRETTSEHDAPARDVLVVDELPLLTVPPAEVERRGRRWLLGSFVFCPCHLPWTLAILGAMLGGTAFGAAIREHTVLAGVVITAVWVAGTARGFVLVRMAEKGTCPPPKARRWGRRAG
ncbi:MAG TPA: hypothetical protein VK866_12875 [Acidimicrobiales bacterium]|nr:hypothetical protein [Acidimicrobiales bacterium]